MVKIWGEKSATGIAAIHFGYGVGAILAPILAEPFIAEPAGNQTLAGNQTVIGNVTSSFGQGKDNEDRIDIPYFLMGTVAIFWALVTLAFYIHSRITRMRSPYEVKSEKRKSFRQIFSFDACPTGSKVYSSILMPLILIYIMLVAGGEETIKNFLYTFATENTRIPFTKEEASTLNSIFWLTYTAGRLVTVIACKYIPLVTLVGLMVSANLVNAFVLGIWGWKIRWVLWVWTGE